MLFFWLRATPMLPAATLRSSTAPGGAWDSSHSYQTREPRATRDLGPRGDSISGSFWPQVLGAVRGAFSGFKIQET